MIDITHKNNTLRTATAQAIVKVSKSETIASVKNKTVPKGDVFEMAKAAGLLGIKKTPELLPDCHPLPIEYASISYKINDLEIKIKVEVKTIYKTGVEVEAMHGASIVALTIYDMLKPIDKGVEIEHIRLIEKKGGKSDFKDKFRENITAAVIVCSDTIATGKKEDKAGKVIKEKLESYGVQINHYEIIPDEAAQIEEKAKKYIDEKTNLVIFTGGTGLSVRDVTPDAIKPLIEKEIPGLMEAARSYGQNRTPYAMLSRGVAGVCKQSVLITLPGSTKGAAESMDALFPAALHLFKIFKGKGH